LEKVSRILIRLLKLRNCHVEPARPAGGLDSASQNYSKMQIPNQVRNGYKGQKELVFHFGFKKKYHLK
jgi:hypothetical protein